MENNIYKKLFEVKKVGITLQRDTSAHNYKYATLSQIQEKLNGELEKQGLLVTHAIMDGKVITRITNTEGELGDFVSSEIKMTDGIKAQDKGSEITYYRRYNLLSLLDLEVEDDDGKKASGGEKKEYSNTDNLPWIEDKNIDNLKNLIDEGQSFTIKQVREKYKVSRENADKLSLLGIS